MGLLFLTTIRARLRARFPHPAKRRADDKRRLERMCQDAGTTRRQAQEIASRFFNEVCE
jgi:hypothetical protein